MTSAPATYDARSAALAASAYLSLSSTMASEPSPVVGHANGTAQLVTATIPAMATRLRPWLRRETARARNATIRNRLGAVHSSCRTT